MPNKKKTAQRNERNKMVVKRCKTQNWERSEKKGNSYIEGWVLFIQNTKSRLRPLYW